MISPFFISPFNNRGKFGGGAAIPFPSGAVAYYKLDEASGAVIDSVAANNGTNVGATPNVAGKINTGYSFDGVNDYINIDPALSAVSSATQGTWNVWVKPVDATPIGQERILTFNDTINLDTFIELRVGAATGQIVALARLSNTAYWALATDTQALTDGVFTMVTIVQDGVSPVLYIDGVQVAQTFLISTDKSYWFNNLPLIDNARLGCRDTNSVGPDSFFNGTLDEIAIFNRPLSASEIFNNLWNNGNGNPYST